MKKLILSFSVILLISAPVTLFSLESIVVGNGMSTAAAIKDSKNLCLQWAKINKVQLPPQIDLFSSNSTGSSNSVEVKALCSGSQKLVQD
jgi:hypothetical protein